MTTKERRRGRDRSDVRKDPDIVYTDPKPFRRNRFILHIVTVVAVVLALVFGMAIFFKVKDVKVSGSDKYTAYEVSQASGIKTGDNLLTLNRASISGKIFHALPYVKSVRISITLPDTVNIQIEEYSVYYALQSTDESWWLIGADAKVLKKITEADAAGHTKITGVRITDPKPGYIATAEEPVSEETLENGETVPVTVYGKERLKAVTDILTQLERNGILDKIKLLDVSDINAIELWRGERFVVYVGDASQPDKKILALKAYFEQFGYDTEAKVDVTLTTNKDGCLFEIWDK